MAFLPPPTHEPLARGSSDVPTSMPGRGAGANLFRFASATGMTDATLLAELKEVLRGLAAEKRLRGSPMRRTNRF